MFNLIGIIFSLLNGIYNTCTIHTQVNIQASVARILFAGFIRIFSTSINKILLDAQITEYNTKLSSKPNTYDDSQHNTNTLPTAPQLTSLNRNHPLSLVPRNFRNLALVKNVNSRPNHIQSPIHNIVTQQSQNYITYEQKIEQIFNLRTIIFLAAKLNPFTVHFTIQPISKTQFPLSHFRFCAT